MKNVTLIEKKNLLEHRIPFKKIYISEDQYIIFITKPEDFSQSISLGNLLHCFVCSEDIDVAQWGIPNEMITYICLPIIKVDIPERDYSLNDDPKVYYILPTINDDPDLSISITIVRALNGLLRLNLVVVAPLEIISRLEPIANDQILFKTYADDFWEMLSDCNILLASQSIAINALLNQIPVIVIGSYGFGGLVTDDTIQNFIKTGFRGRIGGVVGEKIPVASILYEIKYVLDLQDFSPNKPFNLLCDESIDLLFKAFVENETNDKVDKIVSMNQQLCTSFANKKDLVQLKPSLCSSVYLGEGFQDEESEKLLINEYTNKILGVVGTDEMSIISMCNGKNTIQEILSKSDLIEEEEVIDFIKELWRARIIVFSFLINK